METRNKQTDTRGKGGGTEGKNEWEELSVNDPWTWTTGWDLTVGVGDGQGRGKQQGENLDNCNRTIKKILQLHNKTQFNKKAD